MKNLWRFVFKEWFPIIVLIIVTVSLIPRGYKGSADSRDIDIYQKGGVIVALVSRENSSEQLNLLANKLVKHQWLRDGRGSVVCYQFIVLFDPKQGTYFILGGPERNTALMVSKDPEKVLEWFRLVEDLKCNTISM